MIKRKRRDLLIVADASVVVPAFWLRNAPAGGCRLDLPLGPLDPLLRVATDIIQRQVLKARPVFTLVLSNSRSDKAAAPATES